MRNLNRTFGLLMPILVLILLALVARKADCQTTSGSISGTVADPQRAVVAGARVTATMLERNVADTTTTDSTGKFAFAKELPGSYRITVEFPGFKKLEKTGIVVEGTSAVDVGTLTLVIGATTESVEVHADGLQLVTESVDRSKTINNLQMTNLPISGRSYFNMLVTIPGVQTFTNTGITFNVSGAQNHSNQATLDGVGNVDTGGNGGVLITVSTDHVQEFQLETHNFGPEYGRSSGAQLVVVTKSGTSEYHGSGYIYHRNESLNANSFINNRNGVQRSLLRNNNPGFGIGGPVPVRFHGLNKKLFFYWGEEFQRALSPVAPKFSRVPTALERQGDFSQSTDKNGALYPYIRDYTTGLPCSSANISGCFADNGVLGKIPASRLSSITLPILKAFPLPNYAAANTPGVNYISNHSDQTPRREDLVRVDFDPTNKWKLFVRVSNIFDSRNTYYGQFNLGTSFDTTLMHFDSPAQGIAVSAVQVINASTTNEMVAGFSHQHLFTAPLTDGLTRKATGIQTPVLYPAAIVADIIPDFSFNGSRQASTGSLAGANDEPFINGNATIHFADNFVKVMGRHTLKAGFSFERSRKNQFNQGPMGGSFNFGDDTSNSLDSGFGFANAALGIYDNFTQKSAFVQGKYRYTSVDWYVGDTWKVNRRLTLIYGARISYMGPQHDVGGTASTFLPSAFDPSQAPKLYRPAVVNGKNVTIDPTTGAIVPNSYATLIVPGSGNLLNGLLYPGKGVPNSILISQGELFQPRLGFSWDVFGKGSTILRGGVGTYYDRYSGNIVFSLTQNPPAVYQQTLFYGLVKDISPSLTSSALISPINLSADNPNLHYPYTYHFNFGIQQKLPWSMTLDAAYVGSLMRQLLEQPNLNRIPYGATFLPQNQDPTKSTTALLGSSAYAQPLIAPYQGYGSINFYQSGGTANYNGLEVGLNRRYAKGLLLGLAYTWSKTLGTISNDFASGTDLLGRTRQLLYAPTVYDRRQTFSTNWVYELPRLFKSSAVMHAVVDGWQLSGIARAQTGAPFSIGFSIPGYGNQNLTGSYTEGARVQQIGNPFAGIDTSSIYNRLNAAAFGPPPVGTTGTGVQPNSFYGPGFLNFDLGLRKQFAVRERYTFEMRLDAVNAFNHYSPTGINSTINWSNIQGSSVTNLPVNSAGVVTNINGFGSVNGELGARVLQLSAHFRF